MSGVFVVRPPAGPLQVRFYYAPTNREWLHDVLGPRVRLKWNGDHWLIGRSHFATVVEALADRFTSVEVRVGGLASNRCDTRCVNAKTRECVCSCAGSNHRGTTAGWHLVGETTLVQDGEVVWSTFTVSKGLAA